MKALKLHKWDVTPAEARRIQEKLRARVELEDRCGAVCRVVGADVAFDFTGRGTSAGWAIAGVIVYSFPELVELERRTGNTVTLALEPEPCCFLETTDDAVAYFTDHLYAGASAEAVARAAGLPISEAHAALRRHLGVVFDICHQAVEFEAIPEALQKLVAAGIPIFKLQEAAALRMPAVSQATVDVLARYADTIYLTQTVERRNGRITRFLNLEDAFAAWRADPGEREWRTHFHVPVFLDDLGPFRTTRFAIEDALRFHKAKPLSRHLEIETYTWDVLPAELKTGDIVDYVTREIEWVRSQLE